MGFTGCSWEVTLKQGCEECCLPVYCQSHVVHEEFAFVLEIKIEYRWCLDSQSICAAVCWIFLCGLNRLCKMRFHLLDESSRILMYSVFRSMDSCVRSLLSSVFFFFKVGGSSRLAAQWDKTEAHSRVERDLQRHQYLTVIDNMINVLFMSLTSAVKSS